MPKPRKSLISLASTSYYHTVSRGARRAFLCGEDVLIGRSFNHRRGWIEERLPELAQVSPIDACSYAVMNNRAIREEKRGFIPEALPAALKRLPVPPDSWLQLATEFECHS